MRSCPILATGVMPKLAIALILTGWFHGCGPHGDRSKQSLIDISDLDEAWDANNHPGRLRGRYFVQFDTLPRSGDIRGRTPWTDSYWPSYLGGLAQRWNATYNQSGFSYAMLTESQVRSFTSSQIAALSPAEKYDIYLGRYDFPLLKSELQRTSPNLPTWHGLCHGWAPASVHYDEPGPVTLIGANGVKVPFGASDVKALLIYTQQAPETRSGSRMLGARCDTDLSLDPSRSSDANCRDVNAGSFHILLTNSIGLEGTPIIADTRRDEQVWNSPVVGFSTQIASETSVVPAWAAPGTARVVTVNTTVRHMSGVGPSWYSLPASRYPQITTSRVYQYSLELDRSGNIIGGTWHTADRPDFLWQQGAPTLRGYYAAVGDIYRASVGSR